LHGSERVTQICRVDLAPIDDESLFESDHVGRRIARGAQPGRAERGLGHHRHGTLAVRAGDDDGLEGSLRMAQLCAERGNVLEAELHAEPFEAVEKRNRISSQGQKRKSACGPSEGPEGSAAEWRPRARASGDGAPRAVINANRDATNDPVGAMTPLETQSLR